MTNRINRRDVLTLSAATAVAAAGLTKSVQAEVKAAPDAAAPFMAKTHEVRLTEDVTFGTGGVNFTDTDRPGQYRDLLLDIYEPADPSATPRPALVLAFGGAYQRGSRQDDLVDDGGQINTSIAEYCHEFARRGFVCFSIDYRLMPEDPTPGETLTIRAEDQFDFDRVNLVRGLMKLPPADRDMVVRVMEAATDDFTRAVSFVRAQTMRFNVDFNRIAMGGFSAGANTALNAGFAERAPVAAVVALSGMFTPTAIADFITAQPNTPALLMFMAENDLPDLLELLPAAEAQLRSVDALHEIVRVPGKGHFYPRTTPVTGTDGTVATVEDLIAGFLYQHLALAEL